MLADITYQIEVPISVKDAWEHFTIHHKIKRFFGVENQVEIKQGGPYEIYFDINAPIGQRGSENCKVLSFLPHKMLSFTWNAPPHIPTVRNHSYKSFVVITFESINENQSLVQLTHTGWLYEEEEWKATHRYFKQAWQFVLKQLKESTQNG